MARNFTSSADYAKFYSRVEAQFSPEELTREALSEWLNNDAVLDQFSLTREIAIQITDANTIEELKELQQETKGLTIHRSTLLKRIDERVEEIEILQREIILAESLARVETFAKEKKIVLSDEILGRKEKWKDGRKALTIRGLDGRFKSWRLVK